MANPGNQLTPVIVTPGESELHGQGDFSAGTSALFFYTFTDIDGNLYDPSDVGAVVIDPNGDIAATIDFFDRFDLGEFGLTWNIPTTAVIGAYTITLTYVAETTTGPETKTFVDSFVIREKSISGPVNRRLFALRKFTESLIGTTQRIPIFNEPAIMNRSRTEAHLSFKKWNQPAGARVMLNGQLRDSGFTIDYLNGKIIFDSPLLQQDTVSVDYNFRWFADDEIDNFIENGINIFNIWPPATFNSITNISVEWAPVVVYSAAVDVYRRWMMDINFQQPTKIFGSLERSSKVFNQMETAKKNYEEARDKMLEQKKYGPYVGLTRTITVPEFTLPGGRSRWFRMLFKSGV